MVNFLIWVILIYFALLLIWRYVVPFLLKRYLRKIQQRFSQFSEGYQTHEQKREGEINIDSVPDETKKESRPVSEDEYVDFEEIKDNDKNKT
jgi:hypothetical protein